MAGIFDAVATTYPLSVLAAMLLIINWRGLHRSLVRALRKQFGRAGWLIYLGVLVSALASLLKPLIYWQQIDRAHLFSRAHLLQTSATVDTVAFVFEYLCQFTFRYISSQSVSPGSKVCTLERAHC